jgi:molybdopterin converting factor small subunit
MHVTVKLYATLRKGRFIQKTLEFEDGITVQELIKSLSLPENEVTLIFVNGRHAQLQDKLSDGDTVALFPPVGGG